MILSVRLLTLLNKMADTEIEQNDVEEVTSDPTQMTQDSAIPDEDQPTDAESKASSASQSRSAAESYHEAASKVFDMPQDTSGEPAMEEPTSKEPTMEDPVSDEPTMEGVISKESTMEDPVSKEPTSGESDSEVIQQSSEGILVNGTKQEGDIQGAPPGDASKDLKPSEDTCHLESEEPNGNHGGNNEIVKDESKDTIETLGDVNDAQLSLDKGGTEITEQTKIGTSPTDEETNSDQNSQNVEQSTLEQNSDVHTEQRTEQRTNSVAPIDNGNAEVPIDNGNELLISGEKIRSPDEDTGRPSEDEIIQRLEDVNKEVYNDISEDDTKLTNISNDINSPKDDDINNNLIVNGRTEIEASGDASNVQIPAANEIEGISDGRDEGIGNSFVGGISAGGDEGIGNSVGGDAYTVDASEIDQETLVAPSEHQAAVMSEIMSEDLDALRVDQEAMYQDYARQEQAEEENAAIKDQGKQHVTYAELPDHEGVLANDSQVSISKRSSHKGPSSIQRTAPSRMSMSTSKSVQIPKIPSPPTSPKGRRDDMRPGSRKSSQKLPPSLMRMSTVMVSARKRAVVNRQASTYFEERSPTKLLTLDQCINNRPPLPFDLDGPGPWHYTPRNKPLYETNAPEYSMGVKFYERDGGGRTAWAKTWFNSPDNFTRKVRWEKRWPSPANYSSRSPMLGRPQASTKTYPQFSIGVRSNFTINKRGSENEPAPCQYNRDKADNLVMRSAPSFSMAKRTTQTTLGKAIQSTPSPSAYTPMFKHMSSHVHYPSFTIRGIRKQKIHALGPHATF